MWIFLPGAEVFGCEYCAYVFSLASVEEDVVSGNFCLCGFDGGGDAVKAFAAGADVVDDCYAVVAGWGMSNKFVWESVGFLFFSYDGEVVVVSAGKCGSEGYASKSCCCYAGGVGMDVFCE